MPTTAPQQEPSAQIVINSLGETFRRPPGGPAKLIGADSVNISEVAQQVLTPEQLKHWRQTDKQVRNAIDKYVDHHCRMAFVQAAWTEMPLPVFDFYMRVTKLQELNNSRFRVWGEKHGESFDSPEFIWLVTEFRHPAADADFWDAVATAAQDTYETYTLHEEPELDQRWEAGVNGVNEDMSNCTDENAIYGPNHGVLMRHIEFRRNIQSIADSRWSLHELLEVRELMSHATEKLYEQAGVGVI